MEKIEALVKNCKSFEEWKEAIRQKEDLVSQEKKAALAVSSKFHTKIKAPKEIGTFATIGPQLDLVQH